ncbi:hypothetical protein V7182_23945 [Neobacillus drentensis]|uniref:hypothetical protein n=1 Tax=Neobacillus drentensis TaxID=220684 RepID=UPI002FFFB0C7
MCMSVFYTVEQVQQRLEFHELRVVDLSMTGDNPSLLAIHQKQVKRFRSLLVRAAVNGEVDITKFKKSGK